MQPLEPTWPMEEGNHELIVVQGHFGICGKTFVEVQFGIGKRITRVCRRMTTRANVVANCSHYMGTQGSPFDVVSI